MQLLRPILALAATAVSLAAGAAVQRALPSSVVLSSNSLTVRSATGGFSYPIQNGYIPPYASYSVEIGLGGSYAACAARFSNQPVELQCNSLQPIVPGVPKGACTPSDYMGLNNLTWSVSKYAKRYVVQYNLTDVASGKTLVACDEFSKDQFVCDGYYEYSNFFKNLTASVGNKCPTY